jgi:hypothetical protein
VQKSSRQNQQEMRRREESDSSEGKTEDQGLRLPLERRTGAAHLPFSVEANVAPAPDKS